MLRVLFSLVLVATFAFMHVVDVSAASVAGEHPYNRHGRVIRTHHGKDPGGTWGYRAVRAYRRSRYRTTTWQLHPYYRRRHSRPYSHYDMRLWQQHRNNGWAY